MQRHKKHFLNQSVSPRLNDELGNWRQIKFTFQNPIHFWEGIVPSNHILKVMFGYTLS